MTRYVDTGASVRRAVSTQQLAARSTTANPPYEPAATLYGPDSCFAGLQKSGPAAGYLVSDRKTGSQRFAERIFAGKRRFVLQSKQAKASCLRGLDLHRLETKAAVFPADGSLANMSARLRKRFGSELGDFRIVAQSERELLLDARDGSLSDDAYQVSIVAKFFEIYTGLDEGL